MKFYIVDCFAEEKYQGNALLVVVADWGISSEEQQKIAREINFSETTFILSDRQENGGYDVRIWTPNAEVPFAGHPTLGTAYVIQKLLENGENSSVILNLAVGQIPVTFSGDKLTMQQNPPKFGPIFEREEIAEVFGIDAEDISDDYPVQWVSTGLEAMIIPLKRREALADLKMDRDAFGKYVERHPECYCNHLFFVDQGNSVFSVRCLMEDFVEDPATGSANGNLAGYLLRYDYFKAKDISYTVYQGEDMGRVSILHIHAAQNGEDWQIEVGGKWHIVASGEWE